MFPTHAHHVGVQPGHVIRILADHRCDVAAGSAGMSSVQIASAASLGKIPVTKAQASAAALAAGASAVINRGSTFTLTRVGLRLARHLRPRPTRI